MSTIWAFDHIENKHSLCRGKDCTKRFCESLREHAKNAIEFEKKKNIIFNKKELELDQNATECYFCRKKNHKNICKR